METLRASLRNAESLNNYLTPTVPTVALFPAHTRQRHAGKDFPAFVSCFPPEAVAAFLTQDLMDAGRESFTLVQLQPQLEPQISTDCLSNCEIHWIGPLEKENLHPSPIPMLNSAVLLDSAGLVPCLKEAFW